MADAFVTKLIQRHFKAVNGEPQIGGLAVSSIVSQYGTPLFVYDRGTVDRKLSILRDTLPPQFAIHYSVKANPNPVLLKYLVSLGCGLEVASAGEFQLALVAGCPPDQILFAGPGKTRAELDFVLLRGIGEIHIESKLEAERIAAICRQRCLQANVAVRVNPSGEVQGGAMRMGGKPAPFGVDEECLDELLDALSIHSRLELCGIHLFSGTQILDHALLIRQYSEALTIAERVARRLERPLRTIDFGGGFGIPYFPMDAELDMVQFRNALSDLVDRVNENPWFRGTRFIVEPGRYLVGEAGIYITRINDIKTSRGKKFLIVDGGMNHHLAASGNLGQVIKRNFPVAILNKLEAESVEMVDVVGPLCTPLDTLARDARLPKAEVGDLLGIFQSGAYARAASPLGFLSHCSPAEVLVANGNPQLIRRRGTYNDLTRDIVL